MYIHTELYSWDVEAFLDISQYVKLQGGQAFLGYVGSGLIFSQGLPVSSSASTSAFNSEQLAVGRGLFSTLSSDGRNSVICQFICCSVSLQEADTILFYFDVKWYG